MNSLFVWRIVGFCDGFWFSSFGVYGVDGVYSGRCVGVVLKVVCGV